MLGTDKIKKVLDVIIGAANDTGIALEDGKFEGIEATAYLKSLLLVPDIVKTFPELKAQLKDIDNAERQELIDYVKDKFDIPQKRTEAIAEAILSIGFKAIDLIAEIVDVAKKIKGDNIDESEL